MVNICGRNSDDMFFLTRDGNVVITDVGYPGSKGYDYRSGTLYYYARQSVQANSNEDVDEFGRNYIDRLFIRLCDAVFGRVMGKEETFVSLSCENTGENYEVRLELTDEILEMGLAEMVALFEK